MRIRSVVPVLSLFLAAACAAPAPAPPAVGASALEGVEPYTFHLVIGGNTIASDVVRRAGADTEVDLVRTTEGVRSLITMTTGPDERVETFAIRTYRLGAPGADPVQAFDMEFDGDSVRAEWMIPGRGVQRAVRPTEVGAVVYVEPSSAMVEQVLRRARALGGETATVPVLDMGTALTTPAVVRWTGDRSAEVTYGDLEVHAELDADGSLISYTVPALGARATRTEGAHPLVPLDR